MDRNDFLVFRYSDEYSEYLATDHMQNKIKWGDCWVTFSVINVQNFLHTLPPHGSSTLLDPRVIFIFLHRSVSVIFPSIAIMLYAAAAAAIRNAQNCPQLVFVLWCRSWGLHFSNPTPPERQIKYIRHGSAFNKCLGTVLFPAYSVHEAVEFQLDWVHSLLRCWHV